MNIQETKEKTIELLASYALESDIGTRRDIENDILILNENFCHYMVRKHHYLKLEKDDAMQFARMGMLKAIQSFDLAKGNTFTTFAGLIIYKDMVKVARYNAAGKRSGVPMFSFEYAIEGTGALTLEDILSDGIDMEETYTDKEFLKVVLTESKTLLNPNEYVALLHHLQIPDEPLKQSDLAKLMNVSQVHVSRLKSKALEKVQSRFREQLVG